MIATEQLVPMAGRLVGALKARDDEQYRLALLRRVAGRSGTDAFPLFVKLLIIIAESRDQPAQRLVARTLAIALKRMDLPSGELTSWGGSRLPESSAPMTASALSGFFLGGAPKRKLGPIEYLTVWHCQRTQRDVLSADTYRYAIAQLVSLVNVDAEARRLYTAKLTADAGNELEGVYTRDTRRCLNAIAAAWAGGHTPESVARAATDHRTAAGAREGWLISDL